MNTQTTPIIQLVSIDGKATATSVDIANHFEKPHYDVLKAIRELLSKLPDAFCLRNFSLTETIRTSPLNGAPISAPAYNITRDGFTLLAMGFTGKKALAFKLAYIEAFNHMEEALRTPYARGEEDEDDEPRLSYVNEAWFACLQAQADMMGVTALARTLRVSRCTLGRVLHQSAQYAQGSDTYPTLIATRVLNTFFSKKRHQHHAHAIALVRQQQQMGLQF